MPSNLLSGEQVEVQLVEEEELQIKNDLPSRYLEVDSGSFFLFLLSSEKSEQVHTGQNLFQNVFHWLTVSSILKMNSNLNLQQPQKSITFFLKQVAFFIECEPVCRKWEEDHLQTLNDLFKAINACCSLAACSTGNVFWPPSSILCQLMVLGTH